MPDVFKVEVTEKRGKDDVEIKEVNEGMDKIYQRVSDKNFIETELTNLRATYLRLNNKLKKAQGVMGTTVGGLSDKEIAVAAKYVEGRMNNLSANFFNQFEPLLKSFDPFSAEQGKIALDVKKASMIKTLITNPLSRYMNSELDTVLAAADEGGGDEIKTVEILNKPSFKGAYTKKIDNAGKEELEKHASN